MGRVAGKKGSVRLVRGKWIAALRGDHLGSFPTEQEGWDAVNAALKIDEGKAPDSTRLFGDEWFDERELGGDIRGVHKERSVWRVHVLEAAWADWPMKRVRPIDAQEWLNAMAKKHKVIVKRTRIDGKTVIVKTTTDERIERQTVIHARRIASAVFRAACIAGKISSNPFDNVITPKMAKIDEDEDAWTFLQPDEMTRLFAALSKADRALFYTAWYSVAIYGGLRLEEIKGLRWEDVRRGEMRIRRAASNGRSAPLKELSSRRDVPMLRPLREALDAWNRAGGIVRTHGLVFPTDHGSCYGDSYDAAWETQWRPKASIRPYVRFHDLRHTCGSHLVIGTWGRRFELIEVRDWLGHADIQTTQRYAKLGPDSLKNKVAEMERAELGDSQEREQ